MLTGENKKQFEKWLLLNNDLDCTTNVLNGKLGQSFSELFYKLTFEMQIGVYLSYYDSLEEYIHYEAMDGGVYIRDDWQGDFDSRKEAYKEAFKKANDLENEKLNK